MSVIVVVGAQYGGEGKGKIVSYLSTRDDADYVVRCGGPNSGHTVHYNDQIFKLRLLPAGFVNPRSRLLLAAGSIVNLRILEEEIKLSNIDRNRVGIDYNSVMVTDADALSESELGLRSKIGSTLSGTGVAVANRALRNGSAILAKDVPEAKAYLTDVAAEINAAIDKGETCIIEGTQGFGLSLYHTECYPFATSRDTTASAFLSEVGVSPVKVTSIIMAVRTFPIRVEGNSGPLKNEISWEDVRRLSGYPYEIHEFTTVTGRLRRIAKFSLDLVKRATVVNRPTEIALHGADYIDFTNKGAKEYEDLTEHAINFISSLEDELQVPVTFIGTGPAETEIIDRTIRHYQYRNILVPQLEGHNA
jgi:adenylosuccinate synthase